MKKLFITTYTHKYGHDTLITRASKMPTDKQIIRIHQLLDFESDSEDLETFEVIESMIREIF